MMKFPKSTCLRRIASIDYNMWGVHCPGWAVRVREIRIREVKAVARQIRPNRKARLLTRSSQTLAQQVVLPAQSLVSFLASIG
jgi:hypothetical protein